MKNHICQNCRWCYEATGEWATTFAEYEFRSQLSSTQKTVTRLICLYNPPTVCAEWPMNVFPGNRPQTAAEATCSRWEPINE